MFFLLQAKEVKLIYRVSCVAQMQVSCNRELDFFAVNNFFHILSA